MKKLLGLVATLFMLMIESIHTNGLTLKDRRYELEFNSTEFLGVHFDSSFSKAMFIYKKGSQHEISILQFDTFVQNYYPITLYSPFLFIGLLNHGNMILACKSEVVMLNRNDGYSTSNLTDPSIFVRNYTVANQSFFNDFNQTVLIIYDTNKVGEIDVRMPLQSKVNPVETSQFKKNYTVVDMVYINSGKRFALLINENNFESVVIFDQRTKKEVSRLGNEVDDTVRMVYNMESNLIVLVKGSSKTLLIYECDTYTRVGVINFSLTGLDYSKIIGIYSPLGTNILIITTSYEAYFFDLAGKTYIQAVAFSSTSVEIFWVEGTSQFMNKYLRSTKGTTVFNMYTVETTDPRFCHKSCGSSCKEIFKPCYNVLSIVISMALGALATMIIAFIVWRMLGCLVRSSKDKEITDEAGNIYELTEGGDVKPKRHTISLEENDSATI